MTKAEQFIRNYTNHCSNELVPAKDGNKPLYHEWLTPEQALGAVEIERDDLLDKACECLQKHDSYSKPTELQVRDFRKAMKGE